MSFSLIFNLLIYINCLCDTDFTIFIYIFYIPEQMSASCLLNVGGVVASWLVSSTPDQAVRV